MRERMKYCRVQLAYKPVERICIEKNLVLKSTKYLVVLSWDASPRDRGST